MRFNKLTICLIVVLIAFASCGDKIDQAYLKDRMSFTVATEDLVLIREEGQFYFNGTLFTGTAVQTYPNGLMAEKMQFVNGKKNGLHEKYFEDGTLSYQATYKEHKLQGKVKSWWTNGRLRSVSNFSAGHPHGLQRQWYQSGAIFKEMNLVNGKQEGLQRAWRENGKLYANYEAKNGRTYGLKRANLCFTLQDEQMAMGD